MGYVDLVLCINDATKKTCLCVAPKWSSLKTNDEVIIETKQGAKRAIVKNSISVEEDSEVFKFIIETCQATLPLMRVLKKINYNEFEYEGEEIKNE